MARIFRAALFALAVPAAVSAQPVTQLKTMSASGDITGNGQSVIMPGTAGMASLLIQTTGTFNLTWALQCTGDGTTYDTDDEIPVTLVSSSPTPADSVATNAQALYTANIAGCRGVRVIATAFTSGTLTVTMTAISTGGGAAGGGGVLGSVTADTEMPAAAALANSTANPTVPGVAAFSMVWNGATWDRMSVPTAACDDPARVTSVPISTAASGNTELVALTSSQVVYVCGYQYNVSGTVTVKFLYGTGTACGTGGTDLTGAQDWQAREGIAVANGGAVQFKGAASNALCINLSAGVGVRGVLTYVKQ